MRTEHKEYFTFFRVTGTLFILLCHFTSECPYPLLKMSSQFFSIGVEMFIILSGVLFGIQKNIHENPLHWYLKRVLRIFIPYELFVGILFLIHLICRIRISTNWLWFIFGLQGSNVGIRGGDHTWFITPLLICYLITPLLSYLSSRSSKPFCFVIILSVIPILLAIFPQPFVFVIFSLVCWYGIAFILGQNISKIPITRKYACFSFIMMISMCSIRLIARYYFDGSILYDRIAVGYTQTLTSFALLYIFAFLFQNKTAGRIVNYLSSISFEIYLYHYMFCVGPFRIFDITENWILGCCIIFILTICIATVMQRFSKIITERIHI